MAVQQRDRQADSPRLHVSFLGREYAGARGSESFSVTSTLTGLSDGWTLDLPVTDTVNADIPGLNLQRFVPIKLAHADPRVDDGKPVPFVMGVCTRVEHHCSDGASVLRLSGYDLGKLLDSCAKPWLRLRGLSLGAIIDKLLDGDLSKYDPLAEGPVRVRAVAVALRQTSQLADVTAHNFAGVVQEHSARVGRRPERLALVVAYQLAQALSPPMGYGELAQVLFESGVTESVWGGDAISLEANIMQAVRYFKDRGSISTQNYGS